MGETPNQPDDTGTVGEVDKDQRLDVDEDGRQPEDVSDVAEGEVAELAAEDDGGEG